MNERPALRALTRRAILVGALACGLAILAISLVALVLAGPRIVPSLVAEWTELPPFQPPPRPASIDEEGAIVTNADDWPQDDMVVNGSAFDVARLSIPSVHRIIVPAGARIERCEGSEMLVHMKKTVGFAGHPPKPITPHAARRAMGCAWRRTGDVLEVGTFGAWWNMEGSARIRLLVVVPSHVELSDTGAAGAAELDEPGWWRNHRESDADYWYAAGVPAEGWRALVSEPDPLRRAD